MKISGLVKWSVVLLSISSLGVAVAGQTTDGAKLALSVAVRSGRPIEADYSNARNCTPEKTESIDCTAFHYTIQNVGTSSVMLVWTTCSDFFIGVHDFRVSSGEWQTLHYTPFFCTRNVRQQQVLAPGGTTEGEFTVTGLPYDASPLRSPGVYQLRFSFLPMVCDPEPDARRPVKSCRALRKTITDEVEVHVR